MYGVSIQVYGSPVHPYGVSEQKERRKRPVKESTLLDDLIPFVHVPFLLFRLPFINKQPEGAEYDRSSDDEIDRIHNGTICYQVFPFCHQDDNRRRDPPGK